jgi:UDP-glucuronate decarboxylase
MSSTVLKQDLKYIYDRLPERKAMKNARIAVTGCAGFIGYTVMHFFEQYADELGIKSVIGLDNFMLGEPLWLKRIAQNCRITVSHFDVVHDDINSIKGAREADYVMHMASIASPIYYRLHPLETLDANVTGLRRLLDFYHDKNIKGFLFMSSSEIYGNPDEKRIPTPEHYCGYVSSVGPRACYDESKRFGETLCYIFANQYGMPVTIARPFNNYGPGTRLNDRRVTADIVNSIIEGKDIVLYSDGSPKRTFCYIADAVLGYLKALLYGKFDFFNIGIEKPEISMRELAEAYAKAASEEYGYKGSVVYAKSGDADYLTDNPQRRCPDMKKSRELLGYEPGIYIEEGIKRYLRFISESDESEYRW